MCRGIHYPKAKSYHPGSMGDPSTVSTHQIGRAHDWTPDTLSLHDALPISHQEQTQYVQRHSLPKGKVIPSWIHGRSLYSFHTSKWVLRQNFLVQFLQMIPPALNLSTQDTPNASDQISLVRSPWIFNLHCILLFLLLS